MCKALTKYKIITCLSKHYTLEEYPDTLNREFYMVTTGIGEAEFEKLGDIIDKINPKFVCIDVANGYMTKLISFVKRVRKTWPEIVIACGNIVCKKLTEELINTAGADIVKVGIGSGSVCTTRLKTGVGYPQLSAAAECADAARDVGGMIISDGGIVCPGDVVSCSLVSFLIFTAHLNYFLKRQKHWVLVRILL